MLTSIPARSICGDLRVTTGVPPPLRRNRRAVRPVGCRASHRRYAVPRSTMCSAFRTFQGGPRCRTWTTVRASCIRSRSPMRWATFCCVRCSPMSPKTTCACQFQPGSPDHQRWHSLLLAASSGIPDVAPATRCGGTATWSTASPPWSINEAGAMSCTSRLRPGALATTPTQVGPRGIPHRVESQRLPRGALRAHVDGPVHDRRPQ